MLYPPVADLLEKVDSRYLLVNVVAHRARQIAAEAEALQEELSEKPVTLAIQEVADGKLSGFVKEEYKKYSGAYDRESCRRGGKFCHRQALFLLYSRKFDRPAGAAGHAALREGKQAHGGHRPDGGGG